MRIRYDEMRSATVVTCVRESITGELAMEGSKCFGFKIRHLRSLCGCMDVEAHSVSSFL